MKICYFDCFSGISGDMLLGALADAGADRAELSRQISRLGLEAVQVAFEPCARGGIAATKFRVQAPEGRQHRHLSQIERIIRAASLGPAVEERSIAIFRRLAEAEAAIHQMPVEKVHFHEVGAADSIVDIVGACIALELLEADRIYCSPLNVGSGTVQCAHGTLPVPAPATIALLGDAPIYSAGAPMERVTPTGAAIVRMLDVTYGTLPAMRVSHRGYGAGGRDLPGEPNLVRLLVGESA